MAVVGDDDDGGMRRSRRRRCSWELMVLWFLVV